MLAIRRNTSTFNNILRRSYNTLTYEKTFMADDLVIKRTTDLKPKPAADHVYAFGALATDYMLEIDYDYDNGGW
jgi:hypothetical protein